MKHSQFQHLLKRDGTENLHTLLHGGNENTTFVDSTIYGNQTPSGDFVIGIGKKFVGAAFIADNYLTTLFSARNAKVNLAHIAFDLMGGKGVVLRKFKDLFEKQGDEHHEHDAHGDGDESHDLLVVHLGIEHDARPSEAEEEAHDGLHRNEIQAVGIEIDVAAREVSIGVEADEKHDGLDAEGDGGHNGRAPVNHLHDVHFLDHFLKFFHCFF